MKPSTRIEKSGYHLFSNKNSIEDMKIRIRDQIQIKMNDVREITGLNIIDREILSTLSSIIDFNSKSQYLNSHDSYRFILNEQELEWIKRAPDTELVDYLIYRYKFRNWPREKILSSFPLHLLIEPTSLCNIRCVMCFQVDKTFTNKEFMGRMPLELFERIIEEADSNACRAITLASRGEPTLHKDLPKMLELISKKNFLDVKLNTNATKLNEELSRSILKAGVNEMVFSVDAGTKETYESIRVGGKFEAVVQNIDRFNEIRAHEFPNSRTVTRISGVKVNESQNLEQMVDFWSQRVDEVTIKPATARWDSYNNQQSFRSEACELLWERLYVWYDGKINPCDFDYKSFLSVGNAQDITISEAWLGKGYTNLRKIHGEKNRVKLVPCDRCPL